MCATRGRFVVVGLIVLLVGALADITRAAESIDVSYINTDVVFAAVMHPRKLLTDPQLEMLPIEVIQAAGKEYFAVDPLDIEEVIFIAGLAGLANGEPGMGAILRFAKPYDAKAVTAKLQEGAREGNAEGKVDGKTYIRINWPGNPQFCVAMPNDKTLLVGNESQMRRMLTAENVDSPLIKLLKKADTSKSAVAVLDFATLRPLVMLGMQQMPAVPEPFEPFMKLPELVKSMEVSIDVTNSFQLAIRVDGNDEKAAKELKDLAERAKVLAREMLLPMITTEMERGADATQQALAKYVKRIFNTTLDNIKVTQDGESVQIAMVQGSPTVATAGVLVGLLLPAVQSAREAARRAQSMNNMKQIGLAMHNYLATNNSFPPKAIVDKNGKPLLSWRVAILPYLEVAGEKLDFKLDEPWDSEHNKKLLDKMPAVFNNPNLPSKNSTNYLGADGVDGILSAKGVSAQQITDGLSNTIMVVEADRAVPWTKPDDLEFDAEKPLKGLGALRPGGFNALMSDGSVRFLSNTIDLNLLNALMTKAGKEPVSVP